MKRIFLGATVLALAATLFLALFVTPPRENQGGEAVRLLYLHVPCAWLAYLAFGVTAVASVLWLLPRTRNASWDLLAGASAEVGVLFTALMLVVGSLWGRPTWGTWWEWDARLTSTAILFFLYVGYLAAPNGRDRRGTRQPLRDRGADRRRRHADRPLLGLVVADAAPARHRVQRQAGRQGERVDGFHASARGRGVHDALRLPRASSASSSHSSKRVARSASCSARSKNASAPTRWSPYEASGPAAARRGRADMNANWGYVVAGYTIVGGALGAYAIWVRQRIRRLQRSLPDDDPA